MALANTTAEQTRRGTGARRAVLSSFLGSTIEYYDFALYATASSLVFGPVFFASLSPLVATVASYATLAAGFVARPVGGLVFGHFGDRLGRKRMLVVSMTAMGAASALIGVIPAVPTWGATLLVLLRVVQGVAIGGEWGGAALLSAEHAPEHRRGLAASFTMAGSPTGTVLGAVALALAGLLPVHQFLSWGWRIPFLFSAVLLAVGLFVRTKVAESPVFREAAPQAERRRPPFIEVLRRPRAVIVVFLSCLAGFAIQAMFATYGVTYSAGHGLTRSAALLAFAISQALAIPGTLGAAWLSDRYGRRPIMLAGLAGMVVLTYPVFLMLGSGRFALVLTALVLALALCQGVAFGPVAAFISEQFPTHVRYTGVSLGYQTASVVGAGFTPLVVAALAANTHGSTTALMVYLVGLCLGSGLVIALCTKETKDVALS
ncbi:MFS transporter [Amycolatopsis dongchuanensis]|uniref:MFS transporter n=1 Tax=Amycolatopsis dongchuanensis TaxID=1070866 RepID=A0ABP9Q851_9PSEU